LRLLIARPGDVLARCATRSGGIRRGGV